jgi:type I restriction-modification system DNA methylase subunit
VKISDDILAILSASAVSAAGVRLPDGQLDRKTYVKVDKVLKALGGKWNRKLKFHIFADDALEVVEHAILTGEVATAKDIGFFPTPLAIGRHLVELAELQADMDVLEPSAGTGAIIQAMTEAHKRDINVVAVERDVAMAKQIRAKFAFNVVVQQDDFLGGNYGMFDRVIMNPPFLREKKRYAHLRHVRHAWRHLLPGGRLVSVLPKGVDFREDRAHAEFRKWFQQHGHTTDLPERAFAESGTNVRTVVLVMDRPDASSSSLVAES